MLPEQVTIKTCVPQQAYTIDKKYPSNNRQNYAALSAAIAVSKEWKQIREDPHIWKHFYLPVDSTRTAENLLETLNTRRFKLLNYIKVMDNDLLVPGIT